MLEANVNDRHVVENTTPPFFQLILPPIVGVAFPLIREDNVEQYAALSLLSIGAVHYRSYAPQASPNRFLLQYTEMP
jgi:hypothetical protein